MNFLARLFSVLKDAGVMLSTSYFSFFSVFSFVILSSHLLYLSTQKFKVSFNDTELVISLGFIRLMSQTQNHRN